ncbi:DUF4365 domain-containing protein [Streptomyces niveus]|uniref:DUF4365 domain-containing protein n=1 Tax=Streptomyces niveus TaxID=193462 RepID=UPI00386E0968|nr:DUF4365 domain-containing protein [Streptomyces niveus]
MFEQGEIQLDHPIGPTIDRRHLAGNIGESLVRMTFLKAGVPVISVDQGDDYGTDLLVQVPHEGTNRLSGSFLRIQVKCGKSKYHKSDGSGVFRLSADHRAYYADGPIPSILITVNPDTENMHWGDITEQLRRNPESTAVTAASPFTIETVPQILRIAVKASPGEWVLALSSSTPVARRIAIEGCLLTACDDARVLNALRAHAIRMNIQELSFLATRIREEEKKCGGQQTLMDFERGWGDPLEDLLPAGRSYWVRPPYSEELLQQLIDLFRFSRNELSEIIERNLPSFESGTLLDWNDPLRGGASILDMNPGEHAESLMEIFLDEAMQTNLNSSWPLGESRNVEIYCDGYAPLIFMKALELDSFHVQYSCEQAGFRVMDVIAATHKRDPEIAAAMWDLWNQ